MRFTKFDQLSSLRSLHELSPDDFAYLLEELIKIEIQPGGPYKFRSSINQNVALNIQVYRLFFLAGKRLDNVYQYIQKHIDFVSKNDSALLKRLNAKDNFNKIVAHNSLYNSALIELENIFDKKTYKYILPLITKVEQMDKDGEITKLSNKFATSLQIIKMKDSSKTHDILGTANLYTWLAYSLYDDVMDENSNVLNIPIANILARLAKNKYLEAGISQSIVTNIFQNVDLANIQELSYCRSKVEDGKIYLATIPSKKLLLNLLSGRSSAHYAGPHYILRRNFNTEIDDKARRLFNLYCASRQLNDDIHDWEEDLRNGRITYVIRSLMVAAKVEPGAYTLDDLIDRLKKYYWEDILSRLLNECLRMAKTSAKGLETDLYLKTDSAFYEITLKPIINSCEQALNQLEFDKQALEKIF